MPFAPEHVERRRDVRRRPKVIVRLGLVAVVPLLCLAALGVPLLLDAREALDDSAALSSLITREVAVEELRLQMAFERSHTSALVNARMHRYRASTRRR